MNRAVEKDNFDPDREEGADDEKDVEKEDERNNDGFEVKPVTGKRKKVVDGEKKVGRKKKEAVEKEDKPGNTGKTMKDFFGKK